MFSEGPKARMVLKLNERRGRLGIAHMWYQVGQGGGGVLSDPDFFCFLGQSLLFFF